MSLAVTVPGPCFFTTIRFGPSPCILMAISLMLSTMSVTSSRTPAIEENSCNTPSICTDCTAAPCSEDSRIRRSALPSVTPKPRSSGSATHVATRAGSLPMETWSLFGLINSCQFFWITSSPFQWRGLSRLGHPIRRMGKISAVTGAGRMVRAKKSHATTLSRPAAVMRNRCDVADRSNREPGCLQRTQCRLAARTGTGYFNFKSTHAVLLRLLGGIFGGDLRSVGRRLTRALKTHGPGRRPGDRVALRVGNGDHGIVERGGDMRDARGDVFSFAPTDAGCFLTHSQSFRTRAPRSALGQSCYQVGVGVFFLPAIVLAGPLRVRALVWVRWPRTGSPLRWRKPR